MAFVQAVYGLNVTLNPLQQFNSQNTFADFSSSSASCFALGSQSCEPDLQHAAEIINDQARTELVFEDSESAEMGHPAAVSKLWQLYKKTALHAVQWCFEEFGSVGDLQ